MAEFSQAIFDTICERIARNNGTLEKLEALVAQRIG